MESSKSMASPPADDHFLSLELGSGTGPPKAEEDAKPAKTTRLPLPELKKMLSEFIGSFMLILGCVGTSILGHKPSSTFGIHGIAGGAAFTVMAVIFATGHISGAHINPAVTLAFASLRRLPWVQVPLYVVSQVLAAVCATLLLECMFQESGVQTAVTVPSGSDAQSFVVEVIISAMMMFVVTAVATDNRAPGDLSAVAVAAIVYLNNLLASDISGASMNPIRTLGPALVAREYKGLWLYVWGPVIGTQLGAALYTLIRTD